MPTPQELAGPTGAIIALVAVLAAAAKVIAILWAKHLEADKDDRDQRDLAQRLLDVSLQNNASAIAAWNRRIDQDAARARRTDK